MSPRALTDDRGSVLVRTVAAFAGLLVTIASGCASDAIAVDPVAAAATKTHAAGSWRMESVCLESIETEDFTIAGHGTLDVRARRGTMVIRMEGEPEADDAFGAEWRWNGTHVYVRADGEERWTRYEFRSDTEARLDDPTDAERVLGLLRTTGGRLVELGRDAVRGVSVTHYRTTIASSDQDGELIEAGFGPGNEIDVWIDDDGLVRRTRTSTGGSKPDDNVQWELTCTSDYFDFGVPVEVDIPPASEVIEDPDGLP